MFNVYRSTFKIMEKLKQRWNINSTFQLLIILLVFTINGSLSVALAKPFMEFIGLSLETLHPIAFWSFRILLMFVLYQILLVVIGTIFGQHKFFWEMEKKMLSRLGLSRIFNDG